MIESVPAQRILGCLIHHPDRIPEVTERIRPGDFEEPAAGQLYAAMVAIHDRGQRIETDLLVQALGGGRDAHQLARDVLGYGGSVHTLPAHVGAIAELAKLRAVHREAKRLVLEAEDAFEAVRRGCLGEADRVLASATDALAALGDRADSTGSVDLVDAMVEAATLVRARADALRQGLAPDWITTGIDAVDSVTTGYQAGCMYVLGAGSGEGKTALAGYIAAESAIRTKRHTLYVSVEVGARALGMRRLATASGVSGEVMRTGAVSDADVESLLQAMTRARATQRGLVTYEHQPRASVAFVRRRVQRYLRQPNVAPLGLVVVDYIQRLRPEVARPRSREQEVADMSAELLAVAQEHDVPVLVLAQLNRDRAKRADKRPITSDLRESSALEHDAHRVDFLYRPDFYEEGIEPDSRGWVPALYITRKHRDGRVGQVCLGHHPATGRFRDAPPSNFSFSGSSR